jgi:hypothetical protein
MAVKIEDLFTMIASTAESIKILADTDLPQVKEVLYEDKPLLEGCPSRASMAELILRGMKGRIEELTELLAMLDTEIWAGWKDKH